MANQMMLMLTQPERGAIANELRRYGNYRQNIGADLLDSAQLPERREPDPAGITPQVKQMVTSHVSVSEDCERLAEAFNSDNPVPLDRPAVQLIEQAINEAYPDELPPKVARTAMFCRLAQRHLTDADATSVRQPDPGVAVHAETQPRATETFAIALAQHLSEVNAGLNRQLAQLRENQDLLHEKITEQQREIKQLRNHSQQRRRLPNQFRPTFESTTRPGREHRKDQGRTL